ncbi:hypothetical protein ACFFX0_16620 [Citricoccus parietis]|uniref:Uncharacterized protein n=1 Tax=Citricoccus parietis TaxID=592307 RepID=A0ABV5G2N6_9MICC
MYRNPRPHRRLQDTRMARPPIGMEFHRRRRRYGPGNGVLGLVPRPNDPEARIPHGRHPLTWRYMCCRRAGWHDSKLEAGH